MPKRLAFAAAPAVPASTTVAQEPLGYAAKTADRWYVGGHTAAVDGSGDPDDTSWGG
ncbi:hypothetical protein GCM10017688_53920 [Streptomyces ramulosus]